VISSGFMTMRALEVAQTLQADNIGVAVLHCPTIKPLDEAAIVEAVKYKHRLVVVAENHSVIGGLGEGRGECAAAPSRATGGFPTGWAARRVP
jgi:transketolase